MARLEGRLPSKHERRLVVEYVIGQPSPEEPVARAHGFTRQSLAVESDARDAFCGTKSYLRPIARNLIRIIDALDDAVEGEAIWLDIALSRHAF